jgi:uncharacterized protein (TIGR03435 family)
VHPYSFRYTNVSVKKLIAFAYGINTYQIAGVPESIDSERYDVEGTWKEASGGAAMAGPPPPPPPAGAPNNHLLPMQLQAMVQSLLADQFHLKWSQQSQQLPTYELEVASNGPRLTATPATPAPASFNGEPIITVRTQIQDGNGNVSMQNAPAGALASFLATQLDREVVDKTGIKGNYEITLRWTAGPEENESISAALEQQLGLKLEPQQGLVDVLAVSQIEKPAEN